MQNLKFEVNADGVAIITFDMPGRTMNVLNEASIADYAEAVERVLSDDTIKGAVVTSAKPAFIAGADLDWILSLAQADLPANQRAINVYNTVLNLQKIFRRTEKGGKPFVAAINGLALGGGLELCLACTRRIVADDPRIQLGLPEAKVGLLPGGGGTQRFARILGPLQALPLLIEGRSLSPDEALKLKIIDEVSPADQLVSKAVEWILTSSPEDWIKPWDRKGYKLPGDDPRTLEGSFAFSAANALQRKKTYGNYPNLDAIQKAVYDGMIVPIDTAIRIESRLFASLMTTDVAKNMVRTQFINLQKANKQERRPADVPARTIAKLGVIGAGMMGAAIAHVAAKAGIPVVVVDQDAASAEKVHNHIRAVNAKSADKILPLITPVSDYAELAGADLIIEAVFEDSAVKSDVIRKIEQVCPDAIIASNTSSIPISDLARASSKPDRFIGLHFFSPVERMPLVEIIMGEQTGNEALALAIDFVKQLRKTSIVVNDGRFFYTSRVFATYTTEGCLMVQDGIAPALIENAGRMAGMPVAPLALCDEISLDLIYRINQQDAKDTERAFPGSPAEALIQRMVAKEGRLGRKSRKGFYDYPAEGKKRLWPGLAELASVQETQPDVETVKLRLLTIQALEAARCLEEGIVATPADADVGAYLGWGFAPWTGGPLSYIDMLGAKKFVEICNDFAARFGDRFRPTAGLVEMAEQNGSFYPSAASRQEAA